MNIDRHRLALYLRELNGINDESFGIICWWMSFFSGDGPEMIVLYAWFMSHALTRKRRWWLSPSTVHDVWLESNIFRCQPQALTRSYLKTQHTRCSISASKSLGSVPACLRFVYVLLITFIFGTQRKRTERRQRRVSNTKRKKHSTQCLVLDNWRPHKFFWAAGRVWGQEAIVRWMFALGISLSRPYMLEIMQHYPSLPLTVANG